MSLTKKAEGKLPWCFLFSSLKIREENEMVNNNPKGVVVVMDIDNLEITLSRKNLQLMDLKAFISSFNNKKKESLIKLKNREGVLVNPIIYIVSRMMEDDCRLQQVDHLNKLKQDCKDLVKLEVVDPKKTGSHHWHSCTDSMIATYIAMALYDKEVDKIIVVSGDGDFLRPLQKISVVNKEVDMIAVEGAVSINLRDFIESHGGTAHIIRGKVAGLKTIPRKNNPTAPKPFERFANPNIK